jgi:hypothetical protein
MYLKAYILGFQKVKKGVIYKTALFTYFLLKFVVFERPFLSTSSYRNCPSPTDTYCIHMRMSCTVFLYLSGPKRRESSRCTKKKITL